MGYFAVLCCYHCITLTQVGCGGYADNYAGAVSTTGHGESIMRVVLAQGVMAQLRNGEYIDFNFRARCSNSLQLKAYLTSKRTSQIRKQKCFESEIFKGCYLNDATLNMPYQ